MEPDAASDAASDASARGRSARGAAVDGNARNASRGWTAALVDANDPRARRAASAAIVARARRMRFGRGSAQR